MADILRQLLDSGKLSEENCRSILLGLGKDVDELNNNTSQKKKEIVADWSSDSDEEEEEVDPRYSRQVQESQGFDIDNHVRIPTWGIRPCKLGKHGPSDYIALYGRLGVHSFNFLKGRQLKFMRIPKYNTLIYNCSFSYYITVDVEDLVDHSPHTFQTMVTESFPKTNAAFNIVTEICRLKPATPVPFPPDDKESVDEFCRRRMPNFLTHVPRTDRLRFYEVQEQDILENDWLRLYTEFALYAYFGGPSLKIESCLPVEINKILVETPETHEEPCMKLKSSNAIFHINFSAQSRDYRSVVKRVSYEKSANMLLQINTRIIKQKFKKTECV